MAWTMKSNIVESCSCALLCPCVLERNGAQAAPASRPSPAQIKSNLDRILSSPEFQPETAHENPMSKALRGIGDQWDKLMRWLRRLFGGRSRGGGAAIGSAGVVGQILVYAFIGIFIVLMAWLLARVIRSYAGGGLGRL